MIRRAGIQDIPQIGDIINSSAEYGLMLHRSLAFLYEHVRDFHVEVRQRKVVGVCGLSIVWANMAELYALAVMPEFRGKGLGKRLVLSCVDEADELGIRKIMTLTYEQAFFAKCGFHVIDRAQLPMKVWSECIRCSKNQACDEIAMLRVLEDVPEVAVPRPYEPPPGSYEVPVVLKMSGVKRAKMDEAH
ncbi:MAG: N-acetyltransferase [Phycisphaeraceae bacterium]